MVLLEEWLDSTYRELLSEYAIGPWRQPVLSEANTATHAASSLIPEPCACLRPRPIRIGAGFLHASPHRILISRYAERTDFQGGAFILVGWLACPPVY